MKILITSGGTAEPIDAVRFITNFSTGKTGAALAEVFTQKGEEVILLRSRHAVSPTLPIDIVEFGSFADLDEKMRSILETTSVDAIVHLAAVSDFSVDHLLSGDQKVTTFDGKLDSEKSLTIHLKRNFKILDRLKDYAKNTPLIIGFKLTKNADKRTVQDKIAKLFSNKQVDIVVHNDLSAISEENHPAAIYREGDPDPIGNSRTKRALGEYLHHLIAEDYIRKNRTKI